MISKANWTDFSSIDGGNALATMNRVLPPWVSLFLVIVIGWQLAKIIWLLVPAPVTDDVIQSPVIIPAASSEASGSADVQIIAANHMFGEAISDAAAATPVPVVDDVREPAVRVGR